MPKAVTLVLNKAEDTALLNMARQDMRPPWEQIRWLVVTEAQRRGLLPATNSNRAGRVLADTGAVAPTTTVSASCP